MILLNNSTEEISPILDKIKLYKQHIVMKFIPMSSDIKSSGFIIASESVSSITSTRPSNMVLASIKIVCTYQFSIYIIISDETTEKIYYLMDCLLFLLRICYPLISHQNLMM